MRVKSASARAAQPSRHPALSGPYTRKRPREQDDRFIPKRVGEDWDFSFLFDTRPSGGFKESDILTQDVKEYVREKYRATLRRAMGFPADGARLLFPAAGERSPEDAPWPVRQRRRPSMTSPDCALDLPDFKALYYYNLLDWGANGYLAAALNWSVFLCHPTTNKTVHLMDVDNSQQSSVDDGEFGTALKWDNKGRELAIGTNKSSVQIWDTKEKKLVADSWCTCIFRQDCTITCLSWSVCNKYLVSGCSAGKLSLVMSPDGRVGDFRTAHEGNVVTLTCSPDGKYLASAGNDNTVRIWTWPLLTPHFELFYDFPARAMAWHPWKASMLAIGGGIKNGTISIYNVNNCCRIAVSTPQTKSIILSLAWSECTGELVASYWVYKDSDTSRTSGYSEVVVLSNLNKVVDKFMIGYQTQVIYLLWSPDGKKIATASTDETLRIWNFIQADAYKNLGDSPYQNNVSHLKNSSKLDSLFSKYTVR